MNKNKSAASDATASKWQNISRDFLGLTLIFLGVFSFLSLLSYSSLDPSWFTASTRTAKNMGGVIGSYWSALLLQSSGAASFVFALSLVLAGVALFRHISKRDFAIACINYFLLILATAATLGLFSRLLLWGESALPLGGVIGSQLSGFFRHYLNTPGAILLNISLFLFALSLSLQISLKVMALYVWWGLSKLGVGIGHICAFAISHTHENLRHTLAFLAPKIFAVFSAGSQALSDKLDRIGAPKTSASTGESLPKIVPANNRSEIIQQASPIFGANSAMNDTSAIAEPTDQSLENPVIIPRGTKDSAVSLEEIPDLTDDLPPHDGESGLLGLVKKAVRENEKAVKGALGKKIPYELPPVSFLRNPNQEETKIDNQELLQKSQLLREKLADFNIDGSVTAVKPGPVVTMYEFKPGPGVKVNSIANLADDLALALSAESLRIVAPIPGRDVVGVEIANKERERVFLKEIIASEAFKDRSLAIPIAIGKDILGNPCARDLRKMPHMLVAGATGSGKSVFINALLCSLLYRFNPDELRLLLVDPKQLELSLYQDIPHLLLPVVTEPKKASLALRWAVDEMDRRYRLIAAAGMREQDGYNQKLGSIGPDRMLELLEKTGDPEVATIHNCVPMTKIVIIIDELADLMMTAKADVETNICRLAQKARAAGIHLVLATQRPSVDVVTGLIKANLPTRISFRLSGKNDSRTIFDSMGAERLVGGGDMLFMPPGESRLVRMHGAYVGEDEIEQITQFWRNQGKPEYREDILIDPEDEDFGESTDTNGGDDDPRFKEALDIAFNAGVISASLLQRRLGIGYPKAARFVEIMEARGIVGPAQGSKPRPVIAARQS